MASVKIMKMKHSAILLLTVAGLAIFSSACSSENDDPTPISSDNVIRFAAASPQILDRAASDITTNSLNQFFVYGYLKSDGSAYMSDVEVNRSGSNIWSYSPVKYWPTSDAVNFYAYAPSGMLPSGTSPLGKIPITNSGYTDYVYAVAKDMSQPASGSNAQVKFNFRHALAKVTVMLSSSESDLKVCVNNVTIAGVCQHGNFSFPSATTEGIPGTASSESIGSWSDVSGKSAAILYMAQRQDEIITLTSEPVDADIEGNGAKFFIPQSLPFVQGADFNNEVYLVLTCAMYDKATGKKVWPNANTPAINLPNGGLAGEGFIYLSLKGESFDSWKAGYHYVYNVVINGHPDMSQIEFGTPTVDSFVTVSAMLQP